MGLLFDGTYESVASNYLFDPVTTRSIHVDSRYMLWNMAEVDGAGNLLREMSIATTVPARKRRGFGAGALAELVVRLNQFP